LAVPPFAPVPLFVNVATPLAGVVKEAMLIVKSCVGDTPPKAVPGITMS
jgi:hypothetical protein